MLRMMKQFLTSVAAQGLIVGLAAAAYELTILHTNDFHSRIEPINKYDSGCSAEDNAERKCCGGSSRRVTTVNDARTRADNTILVDGGDPAKTQLVVTNIDLRSGGDGYDMFIGEDFKAYDFGPDLADVTADDMAAQGD